MGKPWFKVWRSAWKDERIAQLDACERWLWLTCLALANEGTREGYVLLPDHAIAMATWLPVGDCCGHQDVLGLGDQGLKNLVSVGLLKKAEGGYQVVGYERYQQDPNWGGKRKGAGKKEHISFQGGIKLNSRYNQDDHQDDHETLEVEKGQVQGLGLNLASVPDAKVTNPSVKVLVDYLFQSMTSMADGVPPAAFGGGHAAKLFSSAMKGGDSEDNLRRAVDMWVSERPYNLTVEAFKGQFSRLRALAQGKAPMPRGGPNNRGVGAFASRKEDDYNRVHPEVFLGGNKRV